jgi:peptide/nickel transport system substrate-binding protein
MVVMLPRYRNPLFAVRIILAVLMTLVTLCVGTASSASEPGAVTIVLSGEPLSVDPSETSRANGGQVLMRNVLETLTEIDPADSRVMPRLAASWKSIDANTWQFVLRKGVKFHDGTDLNAAVVVFNIKRLYDKKLNAHVRTRFFASVTMEGRALDSNTVEIKTDKFVPLLPTLLATLAICSANTPMEPTRNPIGTGPYRFIKWDVGAQVVLERFDGYWGKQPQVKKATYVWRTESSVRAAMVEIGEADLTPTISAQDAKLRDIDFSYLNSETTLLRIGGEWEPPLNDRRVRMALNLAVDRNAIRGSILSKDVVPATQLIVPNILGHNPDLKAWTYDPQRAKKLLDEARKDGVPVDKEITLVGRIGLHPASDELMEALMTMYAAVGLNVKLKMLEAGVFKPYENKPYPTNIGPYLLQKSHDNNKGDAGFTVFFSYHCKGIVSSTCDKALDDLIDKAQVATGEERRNFWRAAFKRIHEEIIPDVMLFHMVGYARVGKRINFVPSLMTNNEIQLAQITFKQ